jgi:hypothetical protein
MECLSGVYSLTSCCHEFRRNTAGTTAPSAPIVPLTKLGMMDFKSYESTPFTFHSRLILMETITLTYPGHIMHWKPEFANCSSYYRLRDLKSGEILVNLTTPVVDSCDHSFGSAFVDVLKDGTEVLWVFGSAWYRPMRTSTSTSSGLHDRLQARYSSGWAGQCGAGTGANCTVRSELTAGWLLDSYYCSRNVFGITPV